MAGKVKTAHILPVDPPKDAVVLPSEEWLAEAIEVTALVSPENGRRLAREIVERAAG